ncbi:unnamed protein product, partial [marine sediment metagenome]
MSKATKDKTSLKKTPRAHDAFPDRDSIVAFIRAQPSKVGTREIAREFGLKNAARVELKR